MSSHQPYHLDYTLTILCLACIILYADGRLFKNFNSSQMPPSVCSLLRGQFNISITVVRDDRDFGTVVVTSDMPHIQVRGDCEYYMLLKWSNDITWQITEYNPIYEFTVSFTPYKLFPDVTISSVLEIYDSPTKANLLGKYVSYKCSRGESKVYQGGRTGELSYRVAVSVESIQVQVARLVQGQFSPAIHECGTQTRVSSAILADSNLYTWLFLTVIMAPLLLVIANAVGGFLIQNRILRLELKRHRRLRLKIIEGITNY